MTVSGQWQKQELSSGEPQPLFDAASFDVIPGDCKGAKHASYASYAGYLTASVYLPVSKISGKIPKGFEPNVQERAK